MLDVEEKLAVVSQEETGELRTGDCCREPVERRSRRTMFLAFMTGGRHGGFTARSPTEGQYEE